MGVQIAEAIKSGPNGNMIVNLEKSQGPVKNFVKVSRRSSLCFRHSFSSHPYVRIDNTLCRFWVFSISGLDDLKGKKILCGKGSFGTREGEKYLTLFDVREQVEIVELGLLNAVGALKIG